MKNEHKNNNNYYEKVQGQREETHFKQYTAFCTLCELI